MRRILSQNITSGMRLGKPLYSAEGRVLLNAGMELAENCAARLKKLDVTYVYIEDELTQDVGIPDVVSEKVRVEAVAAVKKIMDRVNHDKGFDALQTRKVVQMIADNLHENQGTLLSYIDMRTRNEYLFSHSVNVCILAMLIGMSLRLNETNLINLGMGALLHDVGQTFISPEIIYKTSRLTPLEKQEIKKHPQLGFDILSKNSAISLDSAYCAYQHHERLNGSGYPQQLYKNELHPFAQIVAVADVYDALTSDVPYRNALPTYEALAIIEKAGGNSLDQTVVNAFIRNVAVYPIGCMVRLSNDQIGVVVDISHNDKSKPVVRIIKDKDNRFTTKWQEIDLSKNQQIYIVDVTERE